MARSRLHYTAPEGPHGHWQITDETGAVLVCPHQAPTPQLLQALGIDPDTAAPAAEPRETTPAPVPTEPPTTPAAPASAAAATPGTASGSLQIWRTTTGASPEEPAYWTAEARWSRLPAGAPISYLPGALEALDSCQLTRAQIAEVVAQPERIEAERSDAVACHRSDVRVVVGGDGTALFINRDYTPTADRRRVKAVGPRAGSGARRAPAPTDRRELVALLHQHGFTITRGGKHETVTHRRAAGMITLPLTPSDHRWIHNCLSEVRERFGIDLRAPQSD